MSLRVLKEFQDYMTLLQSGSFWQRARHGCLGVPREEVSSIRLEIFSVNAMRVKPEYDKWVFLGRASRVLSALFRLIKKLYDLDQPLQAERMSRMAAEIGFTCD